ncbi:afadin- and alpha-actinin-binding protein-like isoform X2 [Kryptolebias marmoratus]|uniref:Synovial sarcoma, X breakpoint 2 interacting protein b n=1 Tax=Kryptolebias marmoratus TaxID=37003 RepID=A0A3Q3BJQ4_KRYMA|nr:afadin- and alpha-actinin-binding protein-like isoform X2 [Kryptolebias marmoratus]
MPEVPLVKDVRRSSVECRTPPLRQFSLPSLLLHRSPHTLRAFCTEQNVQECLSHINQEVSSLGLPPVWSELDSSSELNNVSVLNCMYDLIQLHHRSLRTLENMEVEQIKLSSNVDYLKLTTGHLKEQLELSKRENTGLLERERQLQLKVKSLQNCLKNEKEEVQKLQSIISSRASQYNHDMKRKEREFNKLKERLNQLLADKKERKQAIDVLNNMGRADGKRSLWKTEKTKAKHEGEMYKTLLCDYDSRQRELVLENAELKKVLHQMKKEIAATLRLRKLSLKGEKPDLGGTQAASEEEEEEMFDSSKESVELNCVHAREKLTNSIRLQWRKLKSHVERLDSQVFLTQAGESTNGDAVPRETHEEEMERLKLEIQQCKDFIQTQQQLLQQQLSSPCDEDAATLLNDGYMLQEKVRLRDEWKILEEQRKIFEKERKNFTEAAIRLSHERKIFEEDRATWLKHQFLNETKVSSLLAPEKLIDCHLDAASSTPDVSLTSPSVADLQHKLSLIPENRSTKPKRQSEDTNDLCGNDHLQDKQWTDSEDLSSHSLTQEKNCTI